VFDSLGVQKTLSSPDGLSYLSGLAKEDMKFLAGGDYFFILNKTKTVTMSSDLSSLRPFEALIFIKQGNYGADYKVFVDSVQKASKTTSTSVVADISTKQIATDLKNQLVTNLSGFTIEQVGHVIYLSSSTDFTIRTEDSNADRNLSAIKQATGLISDLPTTAKNGFIVEITGGADTNSDNYYLQFATTDGTSFAKGGWVEETKPNTQYKLAKTTMPHALTRNNDGTFTFKALEWTPRGAGDSVTNPNPSFVGSKLSSLFIHKGRLGFTAQDQVVLSDPKDLFSFFRESMLTVLETDPIDVIALTDQIVNINHAISLGDDLILFGDRRQMVLKSSSGTLSNQTADIDVVSSYQCSALCKPVVSGRSIFFSTTNGDRTTVREMYARDSSRGLYDSDNITEHVPWYVSSPYRLSASSDRYTLAVQPTIQGNTLFVYRWFVSNDERLQQAWVKWVFDGVVLNFTIFEDSLYLTIKRDWGIFIEAIGLNSTEVDSQLPVKVLLDHRAYPSKTYNSGTNLTTITLNHPFNPAKTQLIATSGSAVVELIPNATGTSTVVTVVGDFTSHTIYSGLRYNSSFKFSTLFKDTQNSNGSVISETQGRLLLRKLNLNVAKTGFFTVKVTPKYGQETTVRFVARIMGTPILVDSVAIIDKRFETVINQTNTDVSIEVANDSWLPSTFISATWEGFYASRG
jgi:hypothetical protein